MTAMKLFPCSQRPWARSTPAPSDGRGRAPRALVFLASLCLFLVGSWPAMAKPVGPTPGRVEAAPDRLEGMDVKEHLGQKLPLDLGFKDESGAAVRLADYFDGSRPVIITLNYSNCPMLCSLQLNGFVQALKQVKWTAGGEFRIITVSLDPEEPPATAQRTKQRYLSQYARPEAGGGWAFLTGSERSIRALADALGIPYGYNEKRKEYIHPALISLATPDGRIGRYLYGIEYHPKTLELSLAEVSEGKLGSTMDRLILYCFHYDATEGRYAPVARTIMRLGGGLMVVVLGGFLGSFWLMEWRRRQRGRT